MLLEVHVEQHVRIRHQQLFECGHRHPRAAKRMSTVGVDKVPTQIDGARFGQVLDERIAALTLMRDRLDGCIGCGCLSLKTCSLYNRDDRMAVKGPGPRYLMGDRRRKA